MTAKELADAVIAAVRRATAPFQKRLDAIEKTVSEIPSAEKGERGEKGEPGDRGEKGEPGEPGEAGAAGAAGGRGEKGDAGDRGDAGQDGRAGERGENGLPGDKGDRGDAGQDGRAGERGENGLPGDKGDRGDAGENGRDGRDGQIGEKGASGRDGIDGKDGVDALGFDDLQADFDGERTLTLRFVRADQVKAFEIKLGTILDRGVYREGEAYERGDAVTWGGSLWIAQKDAPDGKPEVSRDWRLAVKKGRDAKPAPVKLT